MEVTPEQVSELSQVMQAIAGCAQHAKFAFFSKNDIFANNLTELQFVDPNLTETGLVSQFVFDSNIYDYGGYQIVRTMINNISYDAPLYVVYTFEWEEKALDLLFFEPLLMN